MKRYNTISRIVAAVAGITLVALLLGPLTAGAVSLQPKVQAFYQDSLATKLTTAGTSLTLVRGTDTQGRTLSGYYGFVIDEGTASQETVIGTASGTTVSGLIRGVDVQNATTSVSANIQTHSRGASVKITTWPSLGIINNQLSGQEGISAPIFYQSIATTTIAALRDNLASVGLVQDTAFNGASVINASATNKGIAQLATGAQASASTATGSTGAALVIPSSLATSTYNAGSATNVIPTTGGTGKIDNNFIATSTLMTNINLLGTTTAATSTTYIGSFTAWQIGKQMQVITTTGTSTFSVPAGVAQVCVEVQGAGGGGAGQSGASTAGGGGGAGGYASGCSNVVGTTTIQVFVGTGGTGAGSNTTGSAGTWSTFGTNGSYMSAQGGGGGTTSNAGIAGGTATGGSLNITGQSGSDAGVFSMGGNSRFGGGGASNRSGGAAGTGYGSGGSGGTATGSNGTQGLIVIRW